MLSQGPWVIFGQYLTVKPWTIDFNPGLPYPNMVLTWIRFPGLPSHLYKKQTLWEIRGMIGKVTKLDFNTDSQARGRYARMALYVNLEKPLTSKILINGYLQKIEYENYLKENCPNVVHTTEPVKETEPKVVMSKSTAIGDGDYGPWILVEWRNRRTIWKGIKKGSTEASLEEGTNMETQQIVEQAGKDILVDPQGLMANSLEGERIRKLNRQGNGLGKLLWRHSKKVSLGQQVGVQPKGQTRKQNPNFHPKGQNLSGPNITLKRTVISAGKEQATSSHGVGPNQDPLLLAVSAANDPRPFEDLCSTQPSIYESIQNSKSGNFIPSSTSFLNSPNDPSVGKVVRILNSNQAEHVVHFNPTFEENSVTEVGVKENLLNAKNHSAVVRKKNSSPKLDGKEARGRILLTENFLLKRLIKVM
ncbi:hypothetical protein GOBAR_DD07271 [Gossypium barbadense]|nr:hypothetical protein GOBAR_DD07271 [Gossypium barbadense]